MSLDKCIHCGDPLDDDVIEYLSIQGTLIGQSHRICAAKHPAPDDGINVRDVRKDSVIHLFTTPWNIDPEARYIALDVPYMTVEKDGFRGVGPAPAIEKWDYPNRCRVLGVVQRIITGNNPTHAITDAPDLLSERETTHGDYDTTALIAQGLKHVITDHRGNLSAAQCESLDLICTKIARILSGNPNEPDHWLDIEGYARLVTRSLEK